MTFKISQIEYKSQIRTFKLGETSIGGESSLPFINNSSSIFKPCFAIEILMNIPKNYPEVLKNYWGEILNDPVKWAKKASTVGADFLALKFNVNETDLENQIELAVNLLKQILNEIEMPIIIIGSAKRDIDKKLLPKLAEAASRKCVIGTVEEENQKAIVPHIVKNGHCVIARTPIDINLAKELNILLTEQGVDADEILIDPNMGGLGYGLDYGYSVIERIKQAGFDGDLMLNMPITVFVGEESWKVKEAKSDDFDENWGDLASRSIIWECMTASSVLSAGANLLIMWHPEALKQLKQFANNVEQ